MNFTSDTYPDSGLSQSFSSEKWKSGDQSQDFWEINQWKLRVNLYFEPNENSVSIH